MPATELAPIVVLVAVIGLDASVYIDAQAQQARGTPVAASLGSFELTTPVAWFLGCLVLFVVFFPLYIIARGKAG